LKKERRLNERVWYAGQFKDVKSISHVPAYVGDYLGFLKQVKLFDFLKEIDVADGEQELLWSLPSHGKAYSDCGKTLVKGCVEHGDHPDGKDFIRLFRRSCRRSACSVCYESWASAGAERGLIRISAFVSGFDHVDHLINEVKSATWRLPRRYFHERLQIDLEGVLKRSKRKFIHVVFSPPQDSDFSSPEAYRRLRKKAYVVAKRSGLHGGCMVFHPFRLRCSRCKSSIPDHKRVCPSCGSAVFEWFRSPHFHVIGWGWIVNTKKIFPAIGWIVVNLKVRKSVYHTLKYLLSHAGVIKGFHTTTWFGDLAYRKFKSPCVGAFAERCPYCARFLKPLAPVELDRPPPVFSSDEEAVNEFLVEKGIWLSA